MSIELRFFRFLQERIGLDVASVGAPMVERALRQRCAAVDACDLDDYWLRLQQSSDEQQALIEAVIVPETWFFRYPESFTALASLASKRLAELAGARPLRILSLPCSTGEEPYSIAMTLLDAGIGAHAFRVDGMDISPLSISRAEQGLYGRNSFRGSDLEFRQRHFDEAGNGHALHERVRQQVKLQVGNVLDPALSARQGSYDFVFCRNLLIYFDVPTQKRVFEVLKSLIHEQGVLFIGPAEGSLLKAACWRAWACARWVSLNPLPICARLKPLRLHRRTSANRCQRRRSCPLSALCRVRCPCLHAHPRLLHRESRLGPRRQTAVPTCWRRLPGWPMPAAAPRPRRPVCATCSSTRRMPRCFTGWGCSVISLAMLAKRSVITARRCISIHSTLKPWRIWRHCWRLRAMSRVPGACRSAPHGKPVGSLNNDLRRNGASRRC